MSLKFMPLEFDGKSVKEDGMFEGYASTFGNKDEGGDIVMPGAFAKSLTVRPAAKIKMLRDHDPSRLIGVYKTVQEDGKGLHVEGKLIRTTKDGAESYDLMKEGALDSMSIGYRTVDSEYDRQRDARLLKQLDLHEISLVAFPMNPMAEITTVKGAIEFDNREMEDALVVAGVSRAHARKAIGVFRQRLCDAGGPGRDQCDADASAQAAEAANALRKAIEALRI